MALRSRRISSSRRARSPGSRGGTSMPASPCSWQQKRSPAPNDTQPDTRRTGREPHVRVVSADASDDRNRSTPTSLGGAAPYSRSAGQGRRWRPRSRIASQRPSSRTASMGTGPSPSSGESSSVAAAATTRTRRGRMPPSTSPPTNGPGDGAAASRSIWGGDGMRVTPATLDSIHGRRTRPAASVRAGYGPPIHRETRPRAFPRSSRTIRDGWTPVPPPRRHSRTGAADPRVRRVSRGRAASSRRARRPGRASPPVRHPVAPRRRAGGPGGARGDRAGPAGPHM